MNNAVLSSPRDPIIFDCTTRPKEMLPLRYESGRVKLVKLIKKRKSELNLGVIHSLPTTHFFIQDNLSSDSPIHQLVSSGDATWFQNQRDTSVQLRRHAWRRAPFFGTAHLAAELRDKPVLKLV